MTDVVTATFLTPWSLEHILFFLFPKYLSLRNLRGNLCRDSSILNGNCFRFFIDFSQEFCKSFKLSILKYLLRITWFQFLVLIFYFFSFVLDHSRQQPCYYRSQISPLQIWNLGKQRILTITTHLVCMNCVFNN